MEGEQQQPTPVQEMDDEPILDHESVPTNLARTLTLTLATKLSEE